MKVFLTRGFLISAVFTVLSVSQYSVATNHDVVKGVLKEKIAVISIPPPLHISSTRLRPRHCEGCVIVRWVKSVIMITHFDILYEPVMTAPAGIDQVTRLITS